MMNLQDKTVWLTGGTSGIGLALAIKLLEAGATVVVSGRTFNELEYAAAPFKNRLLLLPCDFSDSEALDDIAKKLPLMVDSLDLVILNAGVCEYIDDAKLDLEVFRRVMEINFFASIRCCEIALPLLEKSREKPLIVGISSLSTFLPFTRAEAYGASKAAFTYFLESMRIDLKDRVDVTVVNPGFVETPLTAKNDFEMPFLQSSEQAASHIMKAVHKRPLTYSFPFVFSSMLNMFAVFPRLWKWLSTKFLVKTPQEI